MACVLSRTVALEKAPKHRMHCAFSNLDSNLWDLAGRPSWEPQFSPSMSCVCVFALWIWGLIGWVSSNPRKFSSDGCDGLGQISNLAKLFIRLPIRSIGCWFDVKLRSCWNSGKFASGRLGLCSLRRLQKFGGQLLQGHPYQMNTSSTCAVICQCFIKPHHSFQVRSIPITFD